METIHEKIHALVDKTSDPAILENIYQYLSASIEQSKRYLKDELSEKDLQLLEEAQAQYRRGETIPHSEVMEFLKKWKEK